MGNRRPIVGYIAVEACDDYEQVLALDDGQGLPPGGVLRWAGGALRRTLFPARKDAREAIKRTEHYRLAYGDGVCPEARFCRIEAVTGVRRG